LLWTLGGTVALHVGIVIPDSWWLRQWFHGADRASVRPGIEAPASLTAPDAAGSSPPNPAASPSNDFLVSTGAFCQPRDHVRRLVQRALLHIYGSDGPDLGESEDLCHRKVDAWLRKHDKRTVSRATLRRAKRDLRTELSA
jgi:hypothetical protein